MDLLKIVGELEGKSSYERFNSISRFLDDNDIPYDLHYYSTGSNIVAGNFNKKFIGVGSHFDVVNGSPGANDNASAVAVALGLLNRFKSHPPEVNLVFYFFDEEEKGMKGSKRYIEDYGVKNMNAFINLEMVGMGDKLALWSLHEASKGELLETLERVAVAKGIYSGRFDKVVGRYADHVSFRNAGIEDSFSITSISQEDIDVSYHYYKAQEFDVDKEVLEEIISQAPIFKHYHKPTDLSIHLSEESLKRVEDVVFEAICKLK